jgi:hypothetical protein
MMDQEGSRPYSKDVFPGVFETVERLIDMGKIVCPMEIKSEMLRHANNVPGLKEWVKNHPDCFIKVDIEQVNAMRPIANKYEIYTTDKGDQGDIALIGLAKSRSLIVITEEIRRDQHKISHPKIPNVCDEYDVECINLTVSGSQYNEHTVSTKDGIIH